MLCYNTRRWNEVAYKINKIRILDLRFNPSSGKGQISGGSQSGHTVTHAWSPRHGEDTASTQLLNLLDRRVAIKQWWIPRVTYLARNAAPVVGRNGSVEARSHRHARHDKTVAPACRPPPPPRRRPGRQLRLAARPPTGSDVVRRAKCKHAVDCCVWLNLNFFTESHATTVIYRLTVQTLPDGLETQFTPPDTIQTGLSCLVWRAVRCESGIKAPSAELQLANFRWRTRERNVFYIYSISVQFLRQIK